MLILYLTPGGGDWFLVFSGTLNFISFILSFDVFIKICPISLSEIGIFGCSIGWINWSTINFCSCSDFIILFFWDDFDEIAIDILLLVFPCLISIILIEIKILLGEELFWFLACLIFFNYTIAHCIIQLVLLINWLLIEIIYIFIINSIFCIYFIVWRNTQNSFLFKWKFGRRAKTIIDMLDNKNILNNNFLFHIKIVM